MTSSPPLRPFDRHPVNFTMREMHDTCAAECRSPFCLAETAAGAFLQACSEACSVEPHDREGRIIAAFSRGRAA